MMNLKDSFKICSSSKLLLRIIAITALIGVIDTVYLTVNHYFGADVQCLLLEGCDIVLTSPYSTVVGIPLALLGVVFYSAIFILVNLVDIYEGKFLSKILMAGGIVGFTASLVFLYIQLFIIKALCLYCLTSFVSSTVIFILAIMVYKYESNESSL